MSRDVNMYSATILALLLLPALAQDLLAFHKTRREVLLEREAAMAVGGAIQLTDEEDRANNILMQWKFKEIDDAYLNPKHFKYSNHYFSYKDSIKDSKVYQIIQKMPKGAALHVHDMALLGPDYLLNLTYSDYLYVCYLEEKPLFVFSNGTPKAQCGSMWQLMADVRIHSKNIKKFDANLRKHFTLVIDNPDEVDTDENTVWLRFYGIFSTIVPLLTYRPVWEQYFYDALKKFREDNVMYLEVRSVLPPLYELDGTTYDSLVTAKAYKKVNDKFVQDYPDFIGAKLIYAPIRSVKRQSINNYIREAIAIKNEMPSFFAGFDLVGQEDLGRPLLEFLPALEAASSVLDYFFHAGETDWWGTTTDENLVDALLLGTKRLGHAFALPKHPVLLEEVRMRGVGLEICVISNSVLHLVRDLRNHPLASLLASGAPVVLSSDDPGLWEAEPLSHDFFVAFLGVASRRADLRLLKQLAINSLNYSSLNSQQKSAAMRAYLERWDKFVREVHVNYS